MRSSPLRKWGWITPRHSCQSQPCGPKISAAATIALIAIDTVSTPSVSPRTAAPRNAAHHGASPSASAPASGIAMRGPVVLPPSQ
ncbi:hypothetical protein [Sphingomonas jinjuensis]|uniref:hypothetical protein n=1 Tax=Sphingomonas jinjuensis TaxID=535907 RepID=UPI001FE8501B|nr:hypothetical protein [Sphingomonas jinjuensis]